MRALATSRALAERAARQHGNVTRDQLVDAGWSRMQIVRRTEAGWLIPRHREVYALGHVPRSRESRWHAAVLALGEEAVLSHRAAGALWGIVRGAVPTDVTLPAGFGAHRRDGIVVHRQELPPEHVAGRDGIPTTTLLRTMLDLAAVLRTRRLASAFEQAQVLHHLPPDPLAAEVIARRGHRGNARLRAILVDAVDPAKVRSILELRFLRLCAAHGIPRPHVNERIGPWEVDFLWPEAGLVVETDGYDFHRTAASRKRDAAKDAHLRTLSLAVIRLTWQDVTERPAAVAGRLRARL